MSETGLLLLRRRDVLALTGVSRRKYASLVEYGVLKPLEQKGERRKHLFPVSEVQKLVEV